MLFNRIGKILLCCVFINLIFLPMAWAGIISTKQEIAIGESVAKQIEAQFPLLDDPALQERVQKIGARIAGVTDRQGMIYTFKVLDVDEVNAMAAPGGFIYVFKGLTDIMQTDDELAGILGHEIGHVVKRHSMGQLEKSLGMTLLLGAAFGGESLPLQMVAVNAISAGYSRDDERQADKLGYELSVKAGYNPYGMLLGLMKLDELDPKQKSDLFSDHPEAASRIKLIKRYLDAAKLSVTAKLLEDGTSASVVADNLSLPPFKIARGATAPLYRAYLAAGNLSQISNLPDYSPDKYVLDSDGHNVIICYDEKEIITLIPDDAAVEHIDLSQLVERYVTALRSWKKAAGNN